MNNSSNKLPFTFIDNLSQTTLAYLQDNMKQHTFSKGEIIINKGQMVDGVYLVASGLLRIFSMDSNGNDKPIYSLGAGEVCIFSINCTLKRIAYPAWVTIDSESADIFSIPSVTFRTLYENEPAARDYIFDAMSQRIFDLMTLIEEATILDVGTRINSFLIRSCPEGNCIHISHQEIATSVGTAREVVSRHLKHLERTGYIKLSRMKIEILSARKLACLTNENAL